MYDRFSLARLLRAASFVEPRAYTAAASQIPGWAEFHLDVLEGGTVIKPDLFFMEARTGGA